MRSLFLASFVLATVSMAARGDEKADIRQAVKDAVKADIEDLVKAKKMPKMAPKQVAAFANNFVGYYTDEVIDGIIRTGDPEKVQLRNPRKGWFQTRVGFLAVEGNAGYFGVANRVEKVVTIDNTAEVVFKFAPVGTIAVFMPWDKGAPDVDNITILRPEWDKNRKVWSIKAPGAGSLQLLK